MLLIGDALKRQLVPLRRDGSVQAPWSAFPSEGGDDAAPTALVREADAGRAPCAFPWQPKPGKVCFGPDGRVLRQESLEGWLGPKEGRLFRVDHLVDFQGEVFALAFHLAAQARTPRHALLRFRPKVAGSLSILRLLETQTAPAIMAGRPILSATRSGVFLLNFASDPPAVRQLAPKERRLAAFPHGFVAPPAPPAGAAGLQAALTVESTLESLPVPLSLFALDDRLYPLTRSPEGKGAARWRLFRLDPQADRLEGGWQLPTRAPGILLVPGEKRWAILELGEAQQLLERQLRSLVEIPVTALRGAWPAAAPAPQRAAR